MRFAPYLLTSAVIWTMLVAPYRTCAQALTTLPSTGINAPRATGEPSGSSVRGSSQVAVQVLVTDEDGNVLSALEKAHFRLFDNGVQQKIERFERPSAPMTIVMLMEYSSRSYGYFANKAAYWGSGFVNHLQAEDWVALVTFDLRTTVRVDFTRKRFEIRDALDRLGPPMFSEANLFDALIDTLDKLEEVKGRKSILLLSTGANTFSAAGMDEILDRLKRTDTVIFAIGLAEAESLGFRSSISQAMRKNSLSSFADQTGGIAFFPRFDGELTDIFKSVAGFLRSEYTLGFNPSNVSRDGRYHRLKIEIVGPDDRPLKVRNEKGKLRKVQVYARLGYVADKGTIPRAGKSDRLETHGSQ